MNILGKNSRTVEDVITKRENFLWRKNFWRLRNSCQKVCCSWWPVEIYGDHSEQNFRNILLLRIFCNFRKFNFQTLILIWKLFSELWWRDREMAATGYPRLAEGKTWVATDWLARIFIRIFILDLYFADLYFGELYFGDY